jgi:hypothetical protein
MTELIEQWEAAARAAVLRAARARLRPGESICDRRLMFFPWRELLATVEAARAGSVAALLWLVRAAGPPLLIPLHPDVAALAAQMLADPKAAEAAIRRNLAAWRDLHRAHQMWRLAPGVSRFVPARGAAAEAIRRAAEAEGTVTADAIRKAVRPVHETWQGPDGAWPGRFWTKAGAPF